MRCNKAQENLSLQLDGALPPDLTGSLSAHLNDCADCQEYRDDLLMGTRLLEATEPELPDNFDWKLQLRLNQTLKEAAGEVAYPWEDKPVDRWRWMRNFGSAAAVGMAAVLALAIFLGPMEQSSSPVAQQMVSSAIGGDRLPLGQKFNFGKSMSRPVSTSTASTNSSRNILQLDQGWSGQNVNDLRTINALRIENRKLTQMLYQTRRQNIWMRAQLDTSVGNPVDLGKK